MFQPFMSTRCTSTFYEYEGCLITPFANDLRVREVNLVSEYTHSFNEKCFSSAVRLWIDSFAPSPAPPVVQNERIQVQIECVRCKNHSAVNGASKYAWLPSQIAFTTLASPSGRITQTHLRSFPVILSGVKVWGGLCGKVTQARRPWGDGFSDPGPVKECMYQLLTSRCVNYQPRPLCNLHTGSYDWGHEATALHSPHQAQTRRDRNLATEPPPKGISSSSSRISRVALTLLVSHVESLTHTCDGNVLLRTCREMKTIYYSWQMYSISYLFWEHPYLSNMLDVGWMLDRKRW